MSKPIPADSSDGREVSMISGLPRIDDVRTLQSGEVTVAGQLTHLVTMSDGNKCNVDALWCVL